MAAASNSNNNNNNSNNGEGDDLFSSRAIQHVNDNAQRRLPPSATAKKLLQKELEQLARDPPPNCTAGLKNENNLFVWVATMLGPVGSVYEDGVFNIEIVFPALYPFSPPHVYFRTKIYHCNISNTGVVCLDILEKNWSPVLGVGGLLISISSLLTDCNPDDPIEASIAEMYINDRKKHDKTAREWTKLYAS